jgi:quinol monooxygenase YgiN
LQFSQHSKKFDAVEASDTEEVSMNRSDSDDAIIYMTRITVPPENRKELCQTISSLLDRVRCGKGCLTYRFYEEASDENTFVVIGEWNTLDAWNDYLHSDSFAVLLGSIKLLCNHAHFDYSLLSHAANVEAVSRARIGYQT